MKNAFLFLLCLLLLPGLIACQASSIPNKLDTSLLIKEKVTGMEGLPKSDKSSIPIEYSAMSANKALKALPFKMVLPNSLPFKGKGFNNIDIKDFKHNGRKILASFIAFSTSGEDSVIVLTSNMGSTFPSANRTVQLKHKIRGKEGGDYITFRYHKINYSVTYRPKQYNQLKVRKALVNIANQIIY